MDKFLRTKYNLNTDYAFLYENLYDYLSQQEEKANKQNTLSVENNENGLDFNDRFGVFDMKLYYIDDDLISCVSSRLDEVGKIAAMFLWMKLEKKKLSMFFPRSVVSGRMIILRLMTLFDEVSGLIHEPKIDGVYVQNHHGVRYIENSERSYIEDLFEDFY